MTFLNVPQLERQDADLQNKIEELQLINQSLRKNDKVKVLGRGELKSKLNVEAHAFSATATQAIEKAGGKATTVK